MNIIKQYVEYLKDNPEGYWFKKKPFGWGWTASSWQGWAIIAAYTIAVLFFALTIDKDSPNQEVMFTFVLPVALLTAALIHICYKTGEKPGWQWGFPKSEHREPQEK